MTEIEKAKKIMEISRDLDSAKRDLESKRKRLESDILFDRDVTLSSNDVKYATRRVESLQKELDRLM